MPDNFKHIVEVSFRLAFTPKALTAIAFLAVTLLTLVFKIDVDWARLISLLPLFGAVMVVGITLNLSPVPTAAGLKDHSREFALLFVEADYGKTGAIFPERIKG